MLFSSTVFLLFFLPGVLLVYFVFLRGRRSLQNGWLLLSSLFFYAWGEPWFVLVMLASILWNYGFGRWAERLREAGRPARPAAAAAAVCNLALLFVFKYLGFFVTILNGLGAALPVPQLRLPIGISFFTFQALSYVLDVCRGAVPAQKSPFRLGLYISFFPQLIAGPIVKYQTVARALTDRRETWDDFSAGCCRFLAGLGKKVLLANQLAVAADAVYALNPASLTAPLAWLGAVCYTLQIYFDFSGYSDMALGLGRMFGFHFQENFNYPYFARSVTDFWRRWHISLSSWFRDYVYIPLGGSRTGSQRGTARNLLIVWMCTGLWHGANWTFVCWGMFYFVLLAGEKFFPLPFRLPSWLGRLWTLLMVNFGWVLFRSNTLPAAAAFLRAMFRFAPDPAMTAQAVLLARENAPVLLLAALFSLPLAPRAGEFARRQTGPASALLGAGYTLGMLTIFLASVAFLVKGTYNPFIYFNF